MPLIEVRRIGFHQREARWSIDEGRTWHSATHAVFTRRSAIRRTQMEMDCFAQYLPIPR